MSIQKIGVLGTGQMGTGIVQVFAQSGYDVIAVDASRDMIDRAVKSIDKRLSSRVEKGKMAQDERDKIMGRIELQREAYGKEENLPKQLFEVYDEQYAGLTALKDKYGSVVTPDQLAAG